jgi:VanZ family protein
MKTIWHIVPRWFPAALMMLVIFAFSSQPGESLPDFLNWDCLIKKAGHVIGYGLLALSGLRLFGEDRNTYRSAWLMTILYAMTDEFHQFFVPGRSSSIFDILIFDNLGAVLALWLHSICRRGAEKRNRLI